MKLRGAVLVVGLSPGAEEVIMGAYSVFDKLAEWGRHVTECLWVLGQGFMIRVTPALSCWSSYVGVFENTFPTVYSDSILCGRLEIW